MYWKRWLTALVILPPFILLILKGSQLLFCLTFVAVSVFCLWEYFRIAYAGHNPTVPLHYKGLGYVAGALIVFWAYEQNYLAMLLTLVLNMTVVAAMSIHRFKVNQDAPVIAVKQVFGAAYIALTISFIVLLRASTDGPAWVFFLFWVVAWGDTGALYVGSAIGKHKLCPAVSPKKTVEGALGGLAANLGFAWALKLLFYPEMHPLTCTVFALIVGGVGQIGDLFESEFKRASGVKDSSALLPGHGGFLDRLDAILLAAPVAYLLKEFVLP